MYLRTETGEHIERSALWEHSPNISWPRGETPIEPEILALCGLVEVIVV